MKISAKSYEKAMKDIDTLQEQLEKAKATVENYRAALEQFGDIGDRAVKAVNISEEGEVSIEFSLDWSVSMKMAEPA